MSVLDDLPFGFKAETDRLRIKMLNQGQSEGPRVPGPPLKLLDHPHLLTCYFFNVEYC